MKPAPSKRIDIDPLDSEWLSMQRRQAADEARDSADMQELRDRSRVAAVRYQAAKKELVDEAMIAFADEAPLITPRPSVYLATFASVLVLGAVVFVGWAVARFPSWHEMVRRFLQ
jgi:hypothetical protein